METYARVRGLRRLILPIPVLAPRLAALWVGLVTPIPNRLALPLVEGILHPLAADTRRAQDLFPEVKPLPYRKAVELALERTTLGEVETRWSGTLFGQEFLLEDREGIIREVRSLSARASPELLFQTFSGLGGEREWLVWNWAWGVRGLLDRLLGGPVRPGQAPPPRGKGPGIRPRTTAACGLPARRLRHGKGPTPPPKGAVAKGPTPRAGRPGAGGKLSARYHLPYPSTLPPPLPWGCGRLKSSCPSVV